MPEFYMIFARKIIKIPELFMIFYDIYDILTNFANFTLLWPAFLPCDAMRCRVSVIVILSVCLSVRLSVTLVDCVHMVPPTITISSPQGSPSF